MRTRITVNMDISDEERAILEDYGVIPESSPGDLREVEKLFAGLFDAEVQRVKEQIRREQSRRKTALKEATP